ncbi:MAG: hypothetical protein ACQETE_12140 [Bacteroidota bacterium]
MISTPKAWLLALYAILLPIPAIAFQGGNTFYIDEIYPDSSYHIQSQKAKFAIDPENHVLYIGEDNRLSRWPYKSSSVISVDSLTQSVEDYVMAYDTVNNQLLLWSRGIGSLYAWEESTQRLKRLDQSFDHKNQFGHSASIHPVSGQLYAFGGYGLWTSKNYITRFDEMAREWFVVDDKASSRYPKPRANAYTTWISPDTLVMLGGGVNDSFVPHRTPAINTRAQTLWIFDINLGRWYAQAELNVPDTEILSLNRRNFREFANLYTYSSALDLWFILGLTNNEGSQDIIAVEPGTGRYRVMELPHLDIGRNKFVLNMAWDEQSQQIVLGGVLNTSDEHGYPLFMAYVKSKNWNEFKAQLESPNSVWSVDSVLSYVTISPLGVAWLLLGLLSGGFLVWVTIKGPLVNTDNSDDQKSPSKQAGVKSPSQTGLYITYEEGKNIGIYYFGEKIDEWLTPLQSQIVLFFYLSVLEEYRYRSIEELEELFWREQQNRDYIRKLRNKELNQINEVADKVASSQFHPFIDSKKDPQDKRRLVYGLNRALTVDEHLVGTHNPRFWTMIRNNELSQEAFLRALVNTYKVQYLDRYFCSEQ